MKWDDIQVFLALYERRTFGGAATALNLHGSTTSRRLDAFEEALGVRLFDRTPEGLRPTAAAERMLPAAREIEGLAEGLRRDLQGFAADVSGLVRIALLESLANHLVAPALAPLLERFPQLRIELVGGTAPLDLIRGEADIALRLVRPKGGELIAKQVAQTQMAVFVSRDTPRARSCQTAEQLPWVGWNVANSQNPDALWLAHHVPAENVVLLSPSLEVHLRAVAAGVGAGLLPRELATRTDSLVEIDLGLELPRPMPIWLVCHRALRRVPRIDAVWEFLRKLVSDAMPAG